MLLVLLLECKKNSVNHFFAGLFCSSSPLSSITAMAVTHGCRVESISLRHARGSNNIPIAADTNAMPSSYHHRHHHRQYPTAGDDDDDDDDGYGILIIIILIHR